MAPVNRVSVPVIARAIFRIRAVTSKKTLERLGW